MPPQRSNTECGLGFGKYLVAVEDKLLNLASHLQLNGVRWLTNNFFDWHFFDIVEMNGLLRHLLIHPSDLGKVPVGYELPPLGG